MPRCKKDPFSLVFFVSTYFKYRERVVSHSLTTCYNVRILALWFFIYLFGINILVWWEKKELNLRRLDLQSNALPTELFSHGVPGEARTPDPLIKSQMLFLLSYRHILQDANEIYCWI